MTNYMMNITNDMELALNKIRYEFSMNELWGDELVETYSKMYKISSLIKRPLEDQLIRRIYVENKARRAAKDLANLRHSLQS